MGPAKLTVTGPSHSSYVRLRRLAEEQTMPPSDAEYFARFHAKGLTARGSLTGVLGAE